MRRQVALSAAAAAWRPPATRAVTSGAGRDGGVGGWAAGGAKDGGGNIGGSRGGWEDAEHMATLNARLRLTREHYAGTTTHNRAGPAFTDGAGFGLGLGGRYGFGATPPWERVGAESVVGPMKPCSNIAPA